MVSVQPHFTDAEIEMKGRSRTSFPCCDGSVDKTYLLLPGYLITTKKLFQFVY